MLRHPRRRLRRDSLTYETVLYRISDLDTCQCVAQDLDVPAVPISTPPFSIRRWGCSLRAALAWSASSRLRSVRRQQDGHLPPLVLQRRSHRQSLGPPSRTGGGDIRRLAEWPISEVMDWHVQNLPRQMLNPLYRSLSRSVMALGDASELKAIYFEAVLRPRRAPFSNMIRRARGAGVLPDGLDPELIQDMLNGALLPAEQTEEQLRHYVIRLLTGHRRSCWAYVCASAGWNRLRGIGALRGALFSRQSANTRLAGSDGCFTDLSAEPESIGSCGAAFPLPHRRAIR